MGNSDASRTTKLNPRVSRYVRESGVSNTERVIDNRMRHEMPQQEPRTKSYEGVLNLPKASAMNVENVRGTYSHLHWNPSQFNKPLL